MTYFFFLYTTDFKLRDYSINLLKKLTSTYDYKYKLSPNLSEMPLLFKQNNLGIKYPGLFAIIRYNGSLDTFDPKKSISPLLNIESFYSASTPETNSYFSIQPTGYKRPPPQQHFPTYAKHAEAAWMNPAQKQLYYRMIYSPVYSKKTYMDEIYALSDKPEKPKGLSYEEKNKLLRKRWKREVTATIEEEDDGLDYILNYAEDLYKRIMLEEEDIVRFGLWHEEYYFFVYWYLVKKEYHRPTLRQVMEHLNFVHEKGNHNKEKKLLLFYKNLMTDIRYNEPEIMEKALKYFEMCHYTIPGTDYIEHKSQNPPFSYSIFRLKRMDI